MTPDAALAALRARADARKAMEMTAYHKAKRVCLGVSNPGIDDLVKTWKRGLVLHDRLALAEGLWRSDVHEARVAAAKFLTGTRFRPDDGAVWGMIVSWVPDFDAWAIADHAAIAGQRRLLADPSRLDTVEGWTRAPLLWTRRAALVMTLPWARLEAPAPDDLARRERILGWMAGYVADPEWFIQKAVAGWLRDLSKRDPDRTRAFLEAEGTALKSFARREAARHLSSSARKYPGGAPAGAGGKAPDPA